MYTMSLDIQKWIYSLFFICVLVGEVHGYDCKFDASGTKACDDGCCGTICCRCDSISYFGYYNADAIIIAIIVESVVLLTSLVTVIIAYCFYCVQRNQQPGVANSMGTISDQLSVNQIGYVYPRSPHCPGTHGYSGAPLPSSSSSSGSLYEEPRV